MGLSVIGRHLGLLKQGKVQTIKSSFLWGSSQPVKSPARCFLQITCSKGKGERFRNPPLDSYSITHISGFWNKKEGESMYVDVGKAEALQGAGWTPEKIAEEMHMEPAVIEKAVSDKKTARKKKEMTMPEQGEKAEREKEALTVVLTYGQMQELNEKAAAVGAREALKALEQERRKERSQRADRRLRNTKLLLRNYHMLKEHAEKSVFGRTQMEESALDILESMMSIYDNEVIIESIKRSATRTAVIVAHIETMFGLYAAYCEKSHNREIDTRRYEAVWDMYMAEHPLSIGEIAEKQNISTRNAYNRIKDGIERLTALIFGVDGLNVH